MSIQQKLEMAEGSFLDTPACIERLLKEYTLHPKLIVAFDFDDTVFDFHQRGSDHSRVLDVLRRCTKLGFYLVVFTASDESRWGIMLDYLKHQGIQVSSVNQNPIPLRFGHSGKIYYNILLDDRAGLGQALDTLEYVVKVAEQKYNL
jgi:hypothetical protein